jgi:lipoyl(octanoyl) transferase
MSAGSNYSPKVTLQIYLLGTVDFETMLALQRRLVFDVSGDRNQAVLLLCEHYPMITMGRQASRMQIQFDPREMQLRGLEVRWVNRGGGSLLHTRGQLAVYPILPLDTFSLNLQQYVNRFQAALLETARDCMVSEATLIDGQPGIWASQRLLAHVGLAVRNWVSYYGAALNINPDLDLFRKVHCSGSTLPMTSLDRERHLAVNPARVRERFLERFLEQFPCAHVTIHDHHPDLPAPIHFGHDLEAGMSGRGRHAVVALGK